MLVSLGYSAANVRILNMKNKKSLGQHWLKNRAILDEIAELAIPKDDDIKTCVEIGPGLGTLTSSLLRRFNKVIAIEYDAELARKLPGSFPGKNLQVEHADILQVDLAKLVGAETYVAVGNIPYYITSPIIRKLLTTHPRPAKIVLLMQKEVAERAAAEMGDHSLLSLFVQNLAEVELGPVVKAAEFTPPPKVDSRVLILTPLTTAQIPETALQLAERGFSSPRKKLVANLATPQIPKSEWVKILTAQGINPDARAEDLGLWDWENIGQAQREL